MELLKIELKPEVTLGEAISIILGAIVILGGIWQWFLRRYFTNHVFQVRLLRRNPSQLSIALGSIAQPQRHLYIDGRDIEIVMLVTALQAVTIDRFTLAFEGYRNLRDWLRRTPARWQQANITSIWDLDVEEGSRRASYTGQYFYTHPRAESDLMGEVKMRYFPPREMLKGDTLRLRIGISSEEPWRGILQFKGPIEAA